MLYPSYLNLYDTDELAERAAVAAKFCVASPSAPKTVGVIVSLARRAYADLVPRPSLHRGTFTKEKISPDGRMQIWYRGHRCIVERLQKRRSHH